jgi:ubiquinone/menaquinone biosynthesis C-methylase UbiE
VRDVAAAYDTWAQEYTDRLGSVDQLAAQDRSTIERWSGHRTGRILDAGCGPGQWSDLLTDGGRRDVIGVDGSVGFLDSARRRFEYPDFVGADLAALPLADGSVDSILSWYSIIHTPPGLLPMVLSELARVLRPGGSLLLGFFDGEPGTPFDHTVTRAYYWSADALGVLLRPHGFAVGRAASRQDPGVRRHGELVATLDR